MDTQPCRDQLSEKSPEKRNAYYPAETAQFFPRSQPRPVALQNRRIGDLTKIDFTFVLR